MIKVIVFDLDNVLIDAETIDEVGKRIGVGDEITKITEKAMEGDLDFEFALKKRVSLLKGASLGDIEDVIEKIPLMEGAEDTIRELKRRGYKVATISGSFRNITDRIKKELDLDYAFSNVLHEKNGVLTGKVSGPIISECSKADALEKIAKMENISTSECAAVGDGANDVCMLKKAGFGIAFNAKPILKEIADVVIEKKDLRELLPFFK